MLKEDRQEIQEPKRGKTGSGPQWQPPPPYHPESAEDGDAPSDDAAPEQQEQPDGPALAAAKTLGMGLGALVAVPFAVAGVGVLAVGATLWGAAKVLQGVGQGLAAGPEAVARAAARAEERERSKAGEGTEAAGGQRGAEGGGQKKKQ